MHAILTGLAVLAVIAVGVLALLAVVAVAVLNARSQVVGRGIVLAVDRVARASGGIGLGRYEQRGVRMDVEVDGRPPFVVRTIASIPARFVPDVLPGATVAIRIDPRRPGTLQVLGPGMAAPALAAPVARARSTSVAPPSPDPRSTS